MHAFFNERLKRKLKLFEFVRCFDMALYRLRNKEADAEAKTDNSDPCLTTALQPLEKHAATIFTRRLFLIFRNEIIEEALLIFDGRKEEFDHRIYKFSKYTEFGSTWEVSYHPATSIMKCSCKKFEFFGLPCSHMISVMKCEHMNEIPPGCVMHRWTKQARKVGEQHCQAQFSSTLTQETRFGVLCSFFTEMCYYASQTSEGFEEARNAFFTMTCRMKQLCMAKGTNVDEGKSSLPPFGVGDPKVVNTKGNTAGSYMAKPRKPRRCQCCRVVGHTRRTCPQNDHKTGQVGSNLFEEYDDYDPIGTPTPFTPKRPRNNMRPCKIHPVKRRLFVTNVDTSPVQLSKDVNDLRSCDAQVVQNSAFTNADTSLGVARCIMANGRLGQWLQMLVCVLIFLKTEGFYVGITYVQNAFAKGAVCLDGSPPAYHLDKGFGAGINYWLVHFEGGGWCNNVTTCLARKNTCLGSSKQMANQLVFSGLLSNLQKFNPDFYNWNRIKVMYCDGSSFTGAVEAVNPATNLHFRIFAAVIEDLLAKRMKNAANAIISGGSAGGLTFILHCDNFRALLSIGTKVKCLLDAAYFINTKDVSGTQHIEAFYNDVVTTHQKIYSYSALQKWDLVCVFSPKYGSANSNTTFSSKRSLRFMAENGGPDADGAGGLRQWLKLQLWWKRGGRRREEQEQEHEPEREANWLQDCWTTLKLASGLLDYDFALSSYGGGGGGVKVLETKLKELRFDQEEPRLGHSSFGLKKKLLRLEFKVITDIDLRNLFHSLYSSYESNGFTALKSLSVKWEKQQSSVNLTNTCFDDATEIDFYGDLNLFTDFRPLNCKDFEGNTALHLSTPANTKQPQQKGCFNLRATELRLGLLGSQSPERAATMDYTENEEQQQPLGLLAGRFWPGVGQNRPDPHLCGWGKMDPQPPAMRFAVCAGS
ncbi:unnamed protein product [Camellia sinensis]